MTEDGRVVGIRSHAKGGPTVTDYARVVVGADGRHSPVAKAVSPERYHERPPILAGYYSYWSGLPMDGRFETYIRPGRGFAAMPTHGDLTIRFTTPSRGAVRLGVYDIAGRLVIPCVDGVLDPGDYNLQLDLRHRAPGVYILALSTSAGTTRRRFTYVP